MVGGYAKLGVGIFVVSHIPGFNTKLAPECINVLLLIVHSSEFHHMVAHRRVRPIGSYHQIKLDLYLKRPAIGGVFLVTDFEPRLSSLKVSAGEFVIEQ